MAAAIREALNRPGLDSEYCRMVDLYRLFGIKRGSAYNLKTAKKITTISIREEGKQRGMRLVLISSVRALLSEQAALQASK